jgi:hypothetical protein
MSTITTTKAFRFPMNTRHGSRKALLGAGDELEVYYAGGSAFFKSSGLGEFHAKNKKVLRLIDGGVDVIGKLYVNGAELAITPGAVASVAWADVTGKPSTFAPSTHTHATLDMANFSILQESGKLVIKYGTTIIASFSNAGAFIAKDEVTAFGTP